MKSYLSEFLAAFDYPEESHGVLLDAYDRIISNDETKTIFDELIDEYDKSYNIDYKKNLEII